MMAWEVKWMANRGPSRQHTMHEPGTFLLTYPAWVLIHKDSVLFDDSGKPVDVKQPVKLLSLDDTSGRGMFPVFSDEDLADRFKTASAALDDFVSYPLRNRDILLSALRMIRAVADAVTLDKPALPGKSYAIWPIDYVIPRVETGQPL